jgi:hypothetical protein
VSSPWTFKEGVSSGGPQDLSSIALKGSSINSPRSTTAKEKPAALTGQT